MVPTNRRQTVFASWTTHAVVVLGRVLATLLRMRVGSIIKTAEKCPRIRYQPGSNSELLISTALHNRQAGKMAMRREASEKAGVGPASHSIRIIFSFNTPFCTSAPPNLAV
jgi:hypothetical protein